MDLETGLIIACAFFLIGYAWYKGLIKGKGAAGAILAIAELVGITYARKLTLLINLLILPFIMRKLAYKFVYWRLGLDPNDPEAEPWATADLWRRIYLIRNAIIDQIKKLRETHRDAAVATAPNPENSNASGNPVQQGTTAPIGEAPGAKPWAMVFNLLLLALIFAASFIASEHYEGRQWGVLVYGVLYGLQIIGYKIHHKSYDGDPGETLNGEAGMAYLAEHVERKRWLRWRFLIQDILWVLIAANSIVVLINYAINAVNPYVFDTLPRVEGLPANLLTASLAFAALHGKWDRFFASVDPTEGAIFQDPFTGIRHAYEEGWSPILRWERFFDKFSFIEETISVPGTYPTADGGEIEVESVLSIEPDRRLLPVYINYKKEEREEGMIQDVKSLVALKIATTKSAYVLIMLEQIQKELVAKLQEGVPPTLRGAPRQADHDTATVSKFEGQYGVVATGYKITPRYEKETQKARTGVDKMARYTRQAKIDLGYLRTNPDTGVDEELITAEVLRTKAAELQAQIDRLMVAAGDIPRTINEKIVTQSTRVHATGNLESAYIGGMYNSKTEDDKDRSSGEKKGPNKPRGKKK